MTPTAAQSVLVVDDEPSIRLILRAGLAAAGFAVTEVGDVAAGAEAIRTATRPFAVILLDLSMPGVDGAKFIPFIREQTPATRILVVSGSHEVDVESLGADGFLGKPFTRAVLVDTVKGLIESNNPA